MTPFLELRRVSVQLGRFTLEVDAGFGPGWTALFGPSGAGKTTLLEVVAGLRRPEAGHVMMNGVVLFDSDARVHLPPHRRGIGYVPQDLALFPHLSVRANLEYGRSTASESTLFERVVERLEIDGLLSQRPGALSGGEKQRVALARALLAAPALLMLDEPLTGLDAPLRERILPFLQRVRDEFRVPTLYVTHNPGEVMTLCEHVVVMEAGRVKTEGGARDLFIPSDTPTWRLRDDTQGG